MLLAVDAVYRYMPRTIGAITQTQNSLPEPTNVPDKLGLLSTSAPVAKAPLNKELAIVSSVPSVRQVSAETSNSLIPTTQQSILSQTKK